MFLLLLVISCKKNETNVINTIGSTIVINTDSIVPEYTYLTYSQDALGILKKHKANLNSVLPNVILSEVELYRKTLTEIEKNASLAYTSEETGILSDKVREKSAESILEKEVQLNVIYFELFNELSSLNLKYKDVIKNDKFIDFYDAGPITLSEEVLLKVEELTKEEKKRIELEQRDERIGYALSIVSVIPGASQSKDLLINITRAAKAFKLGKELKENADKVSKISYKVMNKDVAEFVSKYCKNEKLRSVISNRAGYVNKGTEGVKIAKRNFTKYEKEYFKVVENKINGRIGDFSDGILAVHLQKVRDIIKTNAQLLKKNSLPIKTNEDVKL